MEGSIRKRGKKWYYSFEISHLGNKRKRIEKVGGSTKKEAQFALRNALQEYYNAGLHFEVSNIIVKDFMNYWLDNYVQVNCKYNTQLNYSNIIYNHIIPTLGIYQLKALTPNVLQKFINQKFKDGYSKSHLNGISNVLSSSLKYAVHPGNFIKENPMQYVKSPKYDYIESAKDLKVISSSDFNIIINRFSERTSFYIPIMIGYYTGCRIGEVMGLTWDDIDFVKNEISINKIIYKRNQDWYFGSTKTRSSNRTIQVGNSLIVILKKYKKKQIKNRLYYGSHYTQHYMLEEKSSNALLSRIYSIDTSVPHKVLPVLSMICTKENGGLITTESFKYASRVINHDLNIKFNFHSLRHTHATMLIENGANMKDVQVRLGHSLITTTLDTYTHATKKMSDKTVEIFENLSKETI